MKGTTAVLTGLAAATLALAGCGLRPAPVDLAQATPSVAAPTPTFAPAPKSVVPPSSTPCPPPYVSHLGIDNSAVQVGPLGTIYDTFLTSNYWLGPADATGFRWYQVYAGMSGDWSNPPYVPAVWVNLLTVSPDGCTNIPSKVGEYFDPTADGPLRITDVNSNTVYLRTGSGETTTFDLSTHRFTSNEPATTGATG